MSECDLHVSQEINESTPPTLSAEAQVELEKERKREEKRMHVVREIISSEDTYVKRLHTTIEVFLKPMRETAILTAAELESQFGQFEMIHDLHNTLLAELKSYELQDIRIGKVFKAFSFYLKMYKQYLSCYETAMVKRAKLIMKNKRFAEFLDASRSNPLCCGMTFDSFLVEPVQRVPRYRLLFEELLKYTSEENEDHADIVTSLNNVRAVAAENNEAIRQHELMRKVYEVMMKFDRRYGVNLLDDPTRLYVKEGDLDKQCRKGRKEYRFWLFSDKLIYGELNSLGYYKPNRDIPLNSCAVEISTSDPSSFCIRSPSKSFYVWARFVYCRYADCNVSSSAAECASWLQEISKHIPASSTPVKYAPVWNPDTSNNECELCRVHFTILNRKHHCRNCGILVCDACSKRNLLLAHIDKRPVRVCDRCFSSGAIKTSFVEPAKLERQQSNGESVLSYADSDDENSDEDEVIPDHATPQDMSGASSEVALSSPTNDPNKCAVCTAKFSLFSSKNQCQYCYRNVCKQCFGNEILHNKTFLKLCKECTYCVKPADPVQSSGRTSPPSSPPPVPRPVAPVSLTAVFQSEDTEVDTVLGTSSTAKIFAKPAKRASITVLDTEYEIKEMPYEELQALLKTHCNADGVELLTLGVNPAQKEMSLLEEEFEKVFQCSKPDFVALPISRKKQLRKEKGLF